MWSTCFSIFQNVIQMHSKIWDVFTMYPLGTFRKHFLEMFHHGSWHHVPDIGPPTPSATSQSCELTAPCLLLLHLLWFLHQRWSKRRWTMESPGPSLDFILALSISRNRPLILVVFWCEVEREKGWMNRLLNVRKKCPWSEQIGVWQSLQWQSSLITMTVVFPFQILGHSTHYSFNFAQVLFHFPGMMGYTTQFR
jgi:hypothetical protein